jgi:phosphoserine aminotransferase
VTPAPRGTATPAGILIPADLLPSDGRFGSGPSKVPDAAVAALTGAARHLLGTSHRQEPVRDLIGRVQRGLAELFSLPEGYEVVLGNGGAAAFWDVAALCLMERRSQHAVFGRFSARFAAVAAAAPHLVAPDRVEASEGSVAHCTPRADVDTYALTHNETSTGVVAPVRRPAPDGLVVVDATSAAGGLPVDPADFDAYFFSPQKCFASDGGTWVAVLSPAAVARAATAGARTWVPPSLDLGAAVAASRRRETFNTPSLGTLVLMARQLEWMLEGGGLGFAAGRSARSAAILYGWAEAAGYARPFVTDPTARSPVVATVELDPALPAAAVTGVLRANGVVDVSGYRGVGTNQLRVGMFPAVEPSDVEALTACIDYVAGALI